MTLLTSLSWIPETHTTTVTKASLLTLYPTLHTPTIASLYWARLTLLAWTATQQKTITLNNNNSFRTSYNTPPSTRSSEGRVFPTQRRTQPQSRETNFLSRPNKNGFRNEGSQISDSLCYPNGRSPNLSGNGVGYGSNIDSTSQESPKYSSHLDSPRQREYLSQTQLSSPIVGNRCNTNNNYKDIDIETLNLSILKLTDSVDLIHKLFLSLNSSGNILESSLNLSQIS